jgi:hypothetical protein
MVEKIYLTGKKIASSPSLKTPTAFLSRTLANSQLYTSFK